MEILLIVNLALTVVVGAVVVFLLTHVVGGAKPNISAEAADKLAAAQRDEFSRTRLENAEAARAFSEMASIVKKSADATRAEAEGLRKEVRDSVLAVTKSLLEADRAQRTEIGDALKSGAEAIAARTAEFQRIQKDQWQAFSDQLTKTLEATRSESAGFRKEVADSLRTAAETLQKVSNESGATQREIPEGNAE